MHAVARPPLPRAPRRRPAAPARLARPPGSRAAASSSPRSRPSASSASTRPSGRWCGGSRRLLDRFLGEEAERETGGRSSPGCSRPGSARTEEARARRRSKSTAGACTGRSTGSTGRPTGARSSSTTSSRARSRRAKKLEEKAKLQLQLYLIARRRALGRGDGRRPLPPAARHLGPAPARGRRSPTAAEDLADYRWCGSDLVDARRASRSCSRTPAPARARSSPRMRAGDIRRDPGPTAGLRGHDICPRLLRLRADLPPRPRAPRSRARTRSEER